MIRRSAPIFLTLALMPSQSQDWKQANPNYEWSFPRDHWSHDAFRVEWWYFTGHVQSVTEPARAFGYQFTVFRIGVHGNLPARESAWSAGAVLMGHAAVTNLTRGTHYFSEIVYRAAPIFGGFQAFPDSQIALAPGPAGTDGEWTLEWTGDGFRFAMEDDAQRWALSLETEPSKPIVWQGPNGFSRKTEDGSAASMYYSMPRLATVGTITLGDEAVDVQGVSWMDREFSSSQLGAEQVGWDWFGLQLDDGRDLMLYRLRGSDSGNDFRHATVIDSAGSTRYLQSHEWVVNQTGTWHSETTNTTYPSGWHIAIPSVDLVLRVTPLVEDQENVSRLVPDLAYWEGAVRVTDETERAIGRGYAELTGYGRTRRPAF